MRRKITALFLILVLVATSFQGCSLNKDKGDAKQADSNQGKGKQTEQKTTEMGRYMEKEVAFPKLKDKETVVKIIKNKENQIELYTRLKKQYRCYRMKEDQTWERGQAKWLNGGELSNDSIELFDLCCGEDGSYYAVYADYSSKEDGKCHIIKAVAESKKAQEIKIPYLNKKQTKNNYDFYPRIQKLHVLKNGNFVLNDYMSSDTLLILSPKGEELDKISAAETQDTGSISFITSENDIIAADQDQKGILIYDTVNKSKKLLERSLNEHSMAFAREEDGTLYLGNPDGIHRLSSGSTLWETTVDGALNSMSMPSLIIDELFAVKGEEEQFYASYIDTQGGQRLLQYVFDKKVSALPAHEITVYSLQENSTMRQDISLFQAQNTDVKVNYVVAMGDEGGTVSDYIRALNTELLSGSGADVLLLDGLPVDSYLEKGVLADLSDIIRPLMDSGELMSNITDHFDTEGKIYQMPLRFSFPIIIGKKDVLSSVKDMNSIVSYMKENKGKAYMPSVTYSSLLQDTLALYSDDLYENGELKKEKLVEFLKNLKLLADNMKATEYSEEDTAKTDSSFIDSSKLFQMAYLGLMTDQYCGSLSQIYSVSSMLIPNALIQQYHVEYETVNRKFLPTGLIGLNSASKEANIAKQFIAFLYSEKAQESNLYDGFPVNKKAMESWMAYEDKESTFSCGDHEGHNISGSWPAKKERQELLKKIQSLNTPIEINQVIDGIIITEVLPYFTGDIDAEQAANAASSKINTYMSE